MNDGTFGDKLNKLKWRLNDIQSKIVEHGSLPDSVEASIEETIQEALAEVEDVSLALEQVNGTPVRAEDTSESVQLTRLLELSSKLVATPESDAILGLAVRLAVNITSSADRGSLQLLQDDHRLRTVAVSDPDDSIQEVILFRPGQGIAGHCLEKGETINITDVLSDDRFLRSTLPLRFRSLLVTPMMKNDRLLGTLSLSSVKIGAFSRADERLIQLIADQVVLGLENARLITALRLSEAQARRAERQVRAFVQNAHDMIYFQGIDGHKSDLNMINSTITGYSPSDFTNQPDLLRQLIHVDDLKKMEAFFADHPDGTSSFEMVYRLRHKNDNWRWIQSRMVGVKDDDGRHCGYYCIDRDITSQKKAENRLKRAHQLLERRVEKRTSELAQANLALEHEISERKQREVEREKLLAAERKQRLLAETLGDVFLTLVAQTNRNAVLDEILRQVQRVVSYSAANIMLVEDEMLRIAHSLGYEKFDSEKFLANLEQSLTNLPLDAMVVQNQQAIVISDTSQHGDWVKMPGTSWISSFVAVPICLNNRVLGLLRLDSEYPAQFSKADLDRLDSLTHAAAIALENARLHDQARQEITERKQAIRALQESEASLKTIIDNSIQAVILFDRNGTVQAFNKVAKESARNISGNELDKGHSIKNFVPAEKLNQFMDYFQNILNGQSASVAWNLKIEGADTWFEFNFSPVFAEDGRVIGGCCHTVNIDHWKRTTDALAASEARLMAQMRSVLAITRALVRETDRETLLEFIIAQAEQLASVEGATVLLFSEDGQQLKATSPGIAKFGLDPDLRMPLKGSLAEQAIETQQVKISHNSQNKKWTASLLNLLHPLEINTILCAPLIVQNHNLGVLVMWSSKSVVLSPYQTQLMGLFADQAAQALYNAHMHAQNRQLAVEGERHRIARELHDTVTQSLYSISMAARTSLKLLENGRQVKKLDLPLRHILTLSNNALVEMREQIYHLSPTELTDKGLEGALASHCAQIEDRYGLKIELIIPTNFSLSIDQQVALYYIAREALWNTLKHSGATHVQIQLEEDELNMHLTIQDNGIGFDPSIAARQENLGLNNMKERAHLLGGYLEIQSGPDQGCRISAHIPKYEDLSLQ